MCTQHRPWFIVSPEGLDKRELIPYTSELCNGPVGDQIRALCIVQDHKPNALTTWPLDLYTHKNLPEIIFFPLSSQLSCL